MSWYDDIANAKVGTVGPRFTPGNYKLALEYVKENKSDAGHYFIPVFTVLESDSPDIKPGTSNVGYAIRLDGQYENHRKNSLAEVKGLIAALLAMPHDSPEAMAIDGRVIAQALARPCPLRGLVVLATMWLKPPGEKSKPGAKPFTKAAFRPVTPGTVARVQMAAEAAPAPTVAPGPTASPPTSIATAVQAYVAPVAPATSVAPPISMPAISMPVAIAFPPPGWAEHPSHPGYYYNTAKPGWFPQRAELEAAAREGKA